MGHQVTPDEIAAELEGWFATAGAAGLKLPGGWFGRPYDNLLSPTSVVVRADDLSVELDGRHVLTIAMPASIDPGPAACLISAGGKIVWEWREGGTDRIHQETFDGGDVEFLSPLTR